MMWKVAECEGKHRRNITKGQRVRVGHSAARIQSACRRALMILRHSGEQLVALGNSDSELR